MSERSKSQKANKEDIICKKCPTCMIIKTPRVFHCDTCNVCVSVHDHHCPWIGGCIGQRNHKYFYVYVLVTWAAATFLLVLNSSLLGKHLQNGVTQQQENFRKLYIPQIIMIVGMAPPAILLFTLVVYHTYLIFTNGTTQENVRDKYVLWDGNPYNLGTCSKANLSYFLKMQDSLIFS